MVKRHGKAGAAGLLTAGAIAGGVLMASVGANAASGTGTTTTPAAGTTPPSVSSRQHLGPGGANPMRTDEKLVTGSDLATLKAAALKAVPGGTIIRVETDAGDAKFEAHMTKVDGGLVTVKFDKNLAVTGVEDGMGNGDPASAGPLGSGPAGGPAGGSAGGSAQQSTTTG